MNYALQVKNNVLYFLSHDDVTRARSVGSPLKKTISKYRLLTTPEETEFEFFFSLLVLFFYYLHDVKLKNTTISYKVF